MRRTHGVSFGLTAALALAAFAASAAGATALRGEPASASAAGDASAAEGVPHQRIATTAGGAKLKVSVDCHARYTDVAAGTGRFRLSVKVKDRRTDTRVRRAKVVGKMSRPRGVEPADVLGRKSRRTNNNGRANFKFQFTETGLFDFDAVVTHKDYRTLRPTRRIIERDGVDGSCRFI